MLSLLLHGIAIALLISISPQLVQHTAGDLFRFAGDIKTRLVAPYRRTGGGGGGARSPLAASNGHLPKLAPQQFVPPSTRPPDFKPVLMMEASLVAPAELPVSNPLLEQIGDPLGRVGPPSDGPGSGGGIGDGADGGIGHRKGPGYGQNDGGGIQWNGSEKGGVVPPLVLYKVDPEFSEEARKAKYQGTVVLTIEVGPDGRAHAIRVASGLGLGLDEKAIEAVLQWKFRPATRNGRPVTASATIEVNFRLL